MRDSQFERWLLDVRGLSSTTVTARLSNCRSIEKHEGDLDEHFDRDRLASLIDRLAYSAADERNNAPPRHHVPIGGDLRKGSATLKRAATLYREFREGLQGGSRRREPSPPTGAKTSYFSSVLRMAQPLPEQAQPAFAMPATFDIAALIAAGESDQVEFKSSLRMNLETRKRDQAMGLAIVKTIAGFLNTHGGMLIVGISDDGTPIGTGVDEFSSEDKMYLHLTNLVNDKIGKHTWISIHAEFGEYQGTRVLVVRCQKSATPVYVEEETFYIRTGNATNALTAKDAHEYIKANFP